MKERVTREMKRDMIKEISVTDEVVRIIKQSLPCLIPEQNKDM